MKKLIWILTFASLQIHADRAADTRGNSYDFKNRTGSSGAQAQATGDEGLLTPDHAQSLWGFGALPSVSHLEKKLGGRGRRDFCGAEYRKLARLQSQVNATQIPKPLSVLRSAVAKWGISRQMLDKTLAVFLRNQTLIPNQRYITIFDYTQPSSAKRFVILDLWKGEAKGYRSAHGRGSDPRHTGMVKSVSNTDKSLQSSTGCALANGKYRAKVTTQEPEGRWAMTLMGFQASNDALCDRGVYMHSAPYIDYERGVRNSSPAFANKPGRSWGCPVFKYSERDEIFNKLDGGGLVCAWGAEK